MTQVLKLKLTALERPTDFAYISSTNVQVYY